MEHQTVTWIDVIKIIFILKACDPKCNSLSGATSRTQELKNKSYLV